MYLSKYLYSWSNNSTVFGLVHPVLPPLLELQPNEQAQASVSVKQLQG